MKALDLFAGTGWGVACKWLGIEEDGVEMMPEAVATREANGMNTIYRDVWDGLKLSKLQFQEKYGRHDILIASPPCQTFSAAGSGAGRKALDEVLEAIRVHAYKDAAELKKFGDKHDDRTALVLTPLAYIWRDLPKHVVLEQVPTVQPVWEAYAEIMRNWGYTVDTAVLNAEQYGVPQTRRRSILVARLNEPISLPKPTHSRYYSRTPEKLDEGVLKWVSMAEALGWGMTKRPYPTIATGTENGGTDPAALGGSGARAGVYAERSKGNWAPSGDADNDGGVLRINAHEASTLQTFPVRYTQNNRMAHQAVRTLDQPAPTVTAGHDSGNRGFHTEDGFQIATPEEVAALQSYVPPFVWKGAKGKQYLQIGNAVPPVLAAAILSVIINPSQPKAPRRRRTLV